MSAENLDQYEAKAFSQFGEDGITDYIFGKIGSGTKQLEI